MSHLVIPRHHVDNVCKIGQRNDCCRYLTCSQHGFGCEKWSPLKTTIDISADAGDMVAISDNCEGWELLFEKGVTE